MSPTNRADGHDIAQICLAGHVMTDTAMTTPEHRKKFCPHCGKRTIMACAACGGPIQGDYLNSYTITATYRAPYFCQDCGKPFPWTRAQKQAARHLIDLLDNLSDEERAAFKTDIDSLMHDGPKTKVAAHRVQGLLAKAGGAARATLIEVISESISKTAKAILLPGS